MTQHMTIIRGLPCSGKTTTAMRMVEADETMKTVRVERDDIRMMLFGKPVLSHKQEETVTATQHSIIGQALSTGRSVIVSDTNLRAATYKDLYRLGQKYGAEVRTLDVDTDLEECVQRAKARALSGGRDVPEEVIRTFYARYFRKGKFPPIPDMSLDTKGAPDVYHNSETLPPAIIVDVDGTLARNTSGRGFYDWSRVGEDEPIQAVIDVVEAVTYVSGPPPTVFVFSGRDEECYNITEEWLEKHGLRFQHLVMRPRGSMAPDTEVKMGMFNEHIRDKYRVTAVFDDRLSVCRMWHAMGLPLFRVGDPDADF